MEPPIAVQLSYTVDRSSTLRVTFALTPATDRTAASAFLAYRLPLVGIESWEATCGDQRASGRPGERPGQRVFQGAECPGLGGMAWRLAGEQQVLSVGAFTGSPRPPQNPFLLDGGPAAMHLFVALLNGQAVDLPAGKEVAATFDLDLKPK
jgi:hypothetical protein